MRRRLLVALATLAAVVLAFSPLASCSDEAQDETGEAVDEVVDDAAEGVDVVQARTTAEALRTSLKANDTADEEGIRSVAAINEAAEDLPGDPEVTGVDDGDGDGLDDDGNVQVTVEEEQACVILPAEGEDTTVEDGAC